LGSAIGCCSACCGLAGYHLDHPRPNNGPAPWWEILAFFAGMIFVAAIASATIERLLRGGRLTLRRQGVVFRYRADSVFVPWFAIPSNLQVVVEGDVGFLAAGSFSVGAIVHSRLGTVVATGSPIRTKPLAIRKDGTITLANHYKARLAEIC